MPGWREALHNLKGKQREAVQKRFDSKWREGPGGCWVWQGGKRGAGYGSFNFNRKMKNAHIVSYILRRGLPEEGLFLCHICHVKACVNPWHLTQNTQRANQRESSGVPKKRWSEKFNHLLGELPDEEVAKIAGVSWGCARDNRAKRGIKPCGRRKNAKSKSQA